MSVRDINWRGEDQSGRGRECGVNERAAGVRETFRGLQRKMPIRPSTTSAGLGGVRIKGRGDRTVVNESTGREKREANFGSKTERKLGTRNERRQREARQREE